MKLCSSSHPSIFRADAIPLKLFFCDLMSVSKEEHLESSDEGFNMDSLAMINAEHSRSDVTVM